MDGGDGFPLPLENLSCDTLQGIVEWLEEYDFIPSAEAAPQTTNDLTEDFVERCLPEYPTRYDVFRLGELQNFLDGHESPEFGLNRDEAAAERDRLQLPDLCRGHYCLYEKATRSASGQCVPVRLCRGAGRYRL